MLPNGVPTHLFADPRKRRAYGLLRGGRRKWGVWNGVPYPSSAARPGLAGVKARFSVLSKAPGIAQPKEWLGKESRAYGSRKKLGNVFSRPIPLRKSLFSCRLCGPEACRKCIQKGLLPSCFVLRCFALLCFALLRLASLFFAWCVGNWNECWNE